MGEGFKQLVEGHLPWDIPSCEDVNKNRRRAGMFISKRILLCAVIIPSCVAGGARWHSPSRAPLGQAGTNTFIVTACGKAVRYESRCRLCKRSGPDIDDDSNN